MEGIRAVELYARFKRVSASYQPKLKVAPYIDLPEPPEAFGRQHSYIATADQHLRDLTNFVNEYTVNLQHLRVWNTLLEGMPAEELINVLMEFVHPPAYLCLGFPYAFKSRVHSSVATVSHLANEFVRPDWVFVPDLGHSKYETARDQADKWTSWPRLRGALGRVNNRTYCRATHYFRNEFHHGSPRMLEFGVQPFIRRIQTESGFGCAVGAVPPLALDDALPALLVQHTAVLSVHQAFVDLLNEQAAVVMANKRNSGLRKALG